MERKEYIRMQELSKKLFNGDMFKCFTKEEEASPEYQEYDKLVKKFQKAKRNERS